MQSIRTGIEQALKDFNVELTPDTFDSLSLSVSLQLNKFEEDLIIESDLYDIVQDELSKRGL